MDCSWLVDDDCNEDEGSESDPEETQAELETRLYSIVHHSDLSQPLPPELAKYYTVQCGEDGKLTVALNGSLDKIKSEEEKKVDNLVWESEPDNEVAEGVDIELSPEKDDALISNNLLNTEKNYLKRFRYSDVNLDLSDTPLKVNESFSSDINYSNVNYFKITQSFLNKKKVRKLRKGLLIPPSFQTGQSPNWKDTANESFISVGGDTTGSEQEIIEKMVCALKEANPKESNGKLYFLAKALFSHNRKKHRQLKNRKTRKAKDCDKTCNSAFDLNDETFNHKSKAKFVKHSENIKESDYSFDGSVSLNISPFRPLPPPQSYQTLVDLVSEDEVDRSKELAPKKSRKWKSLPKCEIPTKWTKKMIKFYTKPSRSKLEMELNDIFEDLKRNSTDDDWRVDPRDEIGVYESTPIKGKHKNRRCPNCNQRGHLYHDCPSPRKVPTCFLCGQNYHTSYSCPNKICFKCGVYVTNEAYECSSCYYNTFNYDTPCGVCGQVTHRSEICPDLWRSFHATVDGDKKVPAHVQVNERKYCCNCAARGHFSHQCPFPSPVGEQLSSFVKNYSASQHGDGTTEIVVPSHFSYVIDTDEADRFLQKLSDSTNAVIDVEEVESNVVFRVSGTFEQCRNVRNKIEEFVNIRKRKRKEQYPKRKRRRIR